MDELFEKLLALVSRELGIDPGSVEQLGLMFSDKGAFLQAQHITRDDSGAVTGVRSVEHHDLTWQWPKAEAEEDIDPEVLKTYGPPRTKYGR